MIRRIVSCETPHESATVQSTILSAVSHDAARSASLKWEYRMRDALALDADA